MKKFTQNNKLNRLSLLLFLALLTPLNSAYPFAFLFAGEVNGETVVAHPIGYTGAGGVITVSVGIDPTSANASDMVISTQNVIAIYNEALSTTGNLDFGPLPSGNYDFESVLLHEMGHSLGLQHCNLATESGEEGANLNYTKSTNGVDNVFGLDPGVDGIIGSEDDVRGDDVNLNYFKIADNNPFTISGTVDATTYSRDIADLPSGNYSTNADRSVGQALGFVNTEAAMQQGTFFNEQQQTLSADDVAGLRYAMAGLDEIAGTADDYILELAYIGLTASADIVIDFDDDETGFAVSQSGGSLLSNDHIAITGNNIFFNTGTGFNWYFNTIALAVPPAIVCAPFTTALEVDGTVTIQASDVDGGTTDSNGDSFTLSVAPSSFTCAEAGDNIVTLTATDSNGTSSSCTTTVTVLTGGAPLEAICESPTISLDNTGSVTITTADIDGGSTAGNCGFDEIYMTRGTEEVTTNVSTVSAFNGGPNRGCMFDIVAKNNIEINSFDIRPFNTVDGSASYEVYFKTGSFLGSETTSADWQLLASPDLTSVVNEVVTPLNLSLGIDVAKGERVAFYFAPIDGSAILIARGNSTGNLWTSDSNIEIYEGGLHDYPFLGSFSLPFVFNGNVIYDAPALFDGAFDCSNLGENTITLNVKDASGAIESCDAIVTVVDDEDPVLTCIGDQVVNPSSGNSTYEVPDYFALDSVTGTDNCSTVLVNTSQDPVAGTLLSFGVYTITSSAEDENGNVGTCTFQLTVDNSLGINENDFDMSSLELYPNPVKNSIFIKNPQSLNLKKINVYDLSGRLVISEHIDKIQSEDVIDVSTLQGALYICIIETDRGRLVRRIVKD